MMTGSFCFRADPDETSRLLDPDLAGGALLDVGVYPIALAHLVFGGPPDDVAAVAHPGNTGVDEQNGMLLHFPGGAIALLASAVRTYLPEEVVIAGTEGRIRIPASFFNTKRMEVIRGDQNNGRASFSPIHRW